MSIRDWPDVLRGAGIKVEVHAEVNWLSNGTLRDCNIVWHHDASPKGDSPGALNWMKSNYSTSSAQVWVDRAGTWHFISFGVAWHAGRVNDARFDNYNSVGVETDHTTGEEWPDRMLASLRRGTAAILKHEGKSSGNLAFHKTICVPAGRKSDPDGLDLATERNIVQGYINDNNFSADGDDELNDDQNNKLNAIYEFMVNQERAKEGWSYAAQAANEARDVHTVVKRIEGRLGVPNAPYDWLPALNNKIDAVLGLLADSPGEAAQAAADAKEIVDELAKRLQD